MEWITPSTIAVPEELDNAFRVSRNRMSINRYRSRTDVTEYQIATAFSYLRLLDISKDPATVNRRAIRYVTRAVQRGVDPETALSNATAEIVGALEFNYPYTIIMFNTANAAANSEAILTKLTESDMYTELNVRTMVTSTPNHKIHIFERTITVNNEEDRKCYVILNNVDTPEVLFKTAAALMVIKNYFGENTEKLAEAWMTGDGTKVSTVIIEHYKEYREELIRKRFDESIQSILTNLTTAKRHNYDYRIRNLEREINDHYKRIRELLDTLNKIKGEFLLSITINEDDKAKQLINFLNVCKNKISFIKADGNELWLVYKTPLVYFDGNLLENYFASTLRNSVNASPDWEQQLLKDIFIDKKYTLLIESGIAINLNDSTFRNLRPSSVGVYAKGIPNPHHMYYDCWGDYTPEITRALQDSNYVTAITTAFAAMGGINLADTAVVNKFVEDEIHSYRDMQCLKDNETSEYMTIEEYKRRYENAPSETNE
jgi:Icc-related predicted phosphoesterase